MKIISTWTLGLTVLVTLAASLAATYFFPLLRQLAPDALTDPLGLTTCLQVFADGNTPLTLWAFGCVVLTLCEGLVHSERARLAAQFVFLSFWLLVCVLFVNRLIMFGM